MESHTFFPLIPPPPPPLTSVDLARVRSLAVPFFSISLVFSFRSFPPFFHFRFPLYFILFFFYYNFNFFLPISLAFLPCFLSFLSSFSFFLVFFPVLPLIFLRLFPLSFLPPPLFYSFGFFLLFPSSLFAPS